MLCLSGFKLYSRWVPLINVERVLSIRLCEIQCLQQHLPQNWPVHVFSSLWAIYYRITATIQYNTIQYNTNTIQILLSTPHGGFSETIINSTGNQKTNKQKNTQELSINIY